MAGRKFHSILGGWQIGEVEVAYRPRTGHSKVTGTLVGTLRTARDMAAALS